jgi:hypothetical protein
LAILDEPATSIHLVSSGFVEDIVGILSEEKDNKQKGEAGCQIEITCFIVDLLKED